MTVQNAESTLLRAIESVLSQSMDDLQLVLAVLPSHDRTLETCERWAERDIRVDVVPCGAPDQAAAFDAGVDAARGTYVMLMGQGDWLGRGLLAPLVALAAEHDLELVCAALVPEGIEAFSAHVRPEAAGASEMLLLSTDEVRAQAHRFIESDAFGTLRGKMLLRDRVCELGLRMALARDEQAYLISYLEEVARVGVCESVQFHLAAPAGDGGTAVDFECCERDHAHLLGLARTWGLEDDPALWQAIHRRHMRHLIACISRVCAQRSISSIERSDRVRDMIEAPSTQETIRVLQGADRVHRDFGLMFGPIARGNVAACCLSARVSDLIRMPRMPFISRNAAVL